MRFGLIGLALLCLACSGNPLSVDGLLSVGKAVADDKNGKHVVPFKLVRVYDGDTVHGMALIWPGLVQQTAVRVRGIDTPELRGGCSESKALANQARAFTDSLLRTGYRLHISKPEQGKYAGRVVANILIDGQPLGEKLIERGFAKPYNGDGPRPEWCEKEKGKT